MSKYKVILEFEYDVMPQDSQEWLEDAAECWHVLFINWLYTQGIEEKNIVLTLEEYE
jgi:hypothetical protein